jgi:predicted transcriptional regulator
MDNKNTEKISKYHDERLKSGEWFEFPKSFIECMHNLSDASIKIYLLFREEFNWYKNDDRVWPSYETIMNKTGIKSKETVRKALIELAEWGWIKDITRQFSSHNIYHINSVPEKNDHFCEKLKKSQELMSKSKRKSKIQAAISTENELMKSKNCTTISTENEPHKYRNCTLESTENELMKSKKPNTNYLNSNETNLNDLKEKETNKKENKRFSETSSEKPQSPSFDILDPWDEFTEDDSWGESELPNDIENDDIPESLRMTQKLLDEHNALNGF